MVVTGGASEKKRILAISELLGAVVDLEEENTNVVGGLICVVNLG